VAETSFNALAWLGAVLSPACTLDTCARVVMLALVRHAGAGGLAWPGFGKLCAETDLGRTRVITALAELKRRGLVVSSQPERSPDEPEPVLKQYFEIPQERRPNLYVLPLAPPLEALASSMEEGSTRRTSAPRELVHQADGRGAPGALGGVHQADGRGAPGAPKLLTELPTGTTQGTGEALAAPTAPPVPLKLEVLKPPRKRSEQARAARWRRVPPTWAPDSSHRELARKLGVDFDSQLALFKDHEYRDPKSDADACFRTWLKRALEFGPQRARGKPIVQTGGTLRESTDAPWEEPPEQRPPPPEGRKLVAVR
jgi:hypothetical protein